MGLPTQHPLVSGKTTASKLVQALAGVPQDRPPIWLMRQAGRSLPEYRKLRDGIPMLDSCLRPDLAAEITMQPVRRHKVDAGIFFSDIVIPLKLAGVDISIVPSVGPVLNSPVQSRADFNNLKKLELNSLQPITEAIGLVVQELDSLMKNDPQLWNDILNWCAQVTVEFLRAQIMAGVSGIQVFDSWAGRLTKDEYVLHAAPHLKSVMDGISDLPVARIAFGVGTKKILRQMYESGATAMGVDSETSLRQASEILGSKVPLQGNIDPQLLLGPWENLRQATDIAIVEGKSAASHILNLGHGVLPTTDPSVITRLVAYVHGESS
jgi:uroporphyrinogen decarboxylase